MKTYGIYEAKTNLSKLVKKAKKGEVFYIGAHGEPEVLVSPAKPVKKRKVVFGVWANNKNLKYKDEDLEGIDPDIQEMFYGKDWDK